jgi:hypothetical protein
MQFRPIPLSVIAEYIPLTKAEGMAGYSTRAEYYGLFTDPGDYGNLGVMVAFTSIQYYSGKAKFNNHFVFKPFRGRGYFKQMLI